MFEEKDYILRMIHEIVRTLLKLIFNVDIDKEDVAIDQENAELYKRLTMMIDDGDINDAENILTDHLDVRNMKKFQLALMFYDYLNKKDTEFLCEHDFSREEVSDGLKYVVDLYGYGAINDVFLEDLK
ncbi:MAG: hypothetical protein EOM34_11560 [Clostridia bacterium]|jgi:hypothetical protein|nr:DUF6483 family protein [Lachnospiraceae bacterium]NCC01292.1 hypothetical protein [Clostridia bacterium]NCD03139.1 hypothetical protein [Clostridia bacterium]